MQKNHVTPLQTNVTNEDNQDYRVGHNEVRIGEEECAKIPCYTLTNEDSKGGQLELERGTD